MERQLLTADQFAAPPRLPEALIDPKLKLGEWYVERRKEPIEQLRYGGILMEGQRLAKAEGGQK